jgi:indole-3-glycerol phosphate synthase
MSDFLQQMAASSAARAALLRGLAGAELPASPPAPLKLQGFDLIAEIKDRSPSEGLLADGTGDRSARALEYVNGGAAAISVLTEPSRFGGQLSHLREVADAVAGLDVPVMRKDFLVDPLQITEARAAGASGVLLIIAMLSDAQLAAMLERAQELSMFVLLEAFDEQDLRRSSALLAQEKHAAQAADRRLLIGINTRDLRTLAVDPHRLANLAPRLPPGVNCVAESGLHSADDAAFAGKLGYRLALVGTALMKSADPASLIRDMLEAGRSRVAA